MRAVENTEVSRTIKYIHLLTTDLETKPKDSMVAMKDGKLSRSAPPSPVTMSGDANHGDDEHSEQSMRLDTYTDTAARTS